MTDYSSSEYRDKLRRLPDVDLKDARAWSNMAYASDEYKGSSSESKRQSYHHYHAIRSEMDRRGLL